MGAILQAGCVLLAMTLIYVRQTAAAPASKTTTFGELPYHNWSGAYVGGTFGWSGGDARSTLSDPNPTGTANSYGSLYGVLHAGYNVLIPSRIQLGVEADISFPNFLEGDAIATGQRTGRGSVVTDRLDFVSTARGRLGYAFENWMAYTTAGYAWSQARLTESPGARGNDDILRRQRLGWSLGAGAETAFARGWTARLVYLYETINSLWILGTMPTVVQYRSSPPVSTLSSEQQIDLGRLVPRPCSRGDCRDRYSPPAPKGSDNRRPNRS